MGIKCNASDCLDNVKGKCKDKRVLACYKQAMAKGQVLVKSKSYDELAEASRVNKRNINSRELDEIKRGN